MSEKEYTERNELIGKFKKAEMLFRKSGYHRTAYVFLALKREIERMPAADVVPVVRCKDCKYAYINSFSRLSGSAVCTLLAKISDGAAYQVQQDDFCSYGERKENENGNTV